MNHYEETLSRVPPLELSLMAAALVGEPLALDVLGDYYEDRGDRAGVAGARWASRKDKRPYDYYGNGNCLTWYFLPGANFPVSGVGNQNVTEQNCVPEDVFRLLPYKSRGDGSMLYDTESGRFFYSKSDRDSSHEFDSKFCAHLGAPPAFLLWLAWRQLFRAIHMLEGGL